MVHANDLHFGVVVGIDRYPDLNNLSFARSDATAFYEWLTDEGQGGVPPDNVRRVILLDDQIPAEMRRVDGKPDQLKVLEAVREIREKAGKAIKGMEDWKRSRFYFFIAGHGIAPEPREAALLTANAGPDDYGNNVSSALILEFLMKEQKFHELVSFADCCRERVEEASLFGPPWTRVKGNNGEVVVCASYATFFGDLAHEPSPDEIGDVDARRGYFTRALLEGLRGQAVDPNHPHEINSNSLADYIRRRVENLTTHLKSAQRPNTDADPGRPIVFRTGVPAVEVDAASTHAVDVMFITAFNGRVMLRDGDRKQVGQFDAVPGSMWRIDLINGFYQVNPMRGAPNKFKNQGIFEILGAGQVDGRHHVEV